MSLNKASYYILVVAICVLLIVLPQINSTVFANSTISSKFIVFAYSSLGLIGGFLTMLIFSKPKAFQISKLDLGLFLLVSYIIINRYFIQSEYGFSIRFFELIGLSTLYIILRSLPVKAFASFSYPMQILPFKLVASVLLSLLALLDANKYVVNIKQQQITSILSKSAIAVAVILFLVKGIPFTQNTSIAYKDWKTTLSIYPYGDYEGAIDYYKRHILC